MTYHHLKSIFSIVARLRKKTVQVQIVLIVAICSLSLTAHAASTSVIIPGYDSKSTNSLPGQAIQPTTLLGVASIDCCEHGKFTNPPGQHERFVAEWQANGYAGPDALRGSSYSYAGFVPFPKVQLQMQTDRDILFSHNAFAPGDLAVHVNLDAELTAIFSFIEDGGSGSVSASTAVFGNIFTDESLTTPLSSVRALSATHTFIFNKDSDIFEVVAEDLALDFWVRNGDPVSIVTNMAIGAAGAKNTFLGTSGGVRADGTRSLDFNPQSFFNILTPGVTANSVSLGLVNNQLVNFLPAPGPSPVTVPEPGTFILMGSGLAGFYAFRKKLQKKSVKCWGQSWPWYLMAMVFRAAAESILAISVSRAPYSKCLRSCKHPSLLNLNRP